MIRVSGKDESHETGYLSSLRHHRQYFWTTGSTVFADPRLCRRHGHGLRRRQSAGGTGGGGLVTMACDGTITLTNTLTITSATTIDGTGHAVTISGDNTTRVFTVTSPINFTLINLTIANGLAVGTNGAPGVVGEIGRGGAIYAPGATLGLSNCQFLANIARGGVGGPTTGISTPGYRAETLWAAP